MSGRQRDPFDLRRALTMLTSDPILISFHVLGYGPIVVTPWTFVGLIGNGFFSARVLIQWIASEKHKRSVTPVAFWWASLAATFVMVFYSIQRAEIAFLLGYSINIVPYGRNLMLAYRPRRIWHVASYSASVIVFVASIFLLRRVGAPLFHGYWMILGFAGVLMWYTRFLIQWLYAEAKQKSVLPLGFWIWSLTGQLLCLVYSLVLQDLVFILGFLFNGIPIIRNIMLIKRHGAPRPAKVE